MKTNNSQENNDHIRTEAQKKEQKSKLFHAVWIGFLSGILIFGVVAWGLSPYRKLGFLIPMFIPAYFIYRLLKKPPHNETQP